MEQEPDSDSVLDDLLSRAADQLKVGGEIGPNDDVFRDLNVDGLDWGLFVWEAIDFYGVDIPEEVDMDNVRTIAQVAKLIKDYSDGQSRT